MYVFIYLHFYLFILSFGTDGPPYLTLWCSFFKSGDCWTLIIEGEIELIKEGKKPKPHLEKNRVSEIYIVHLLLSSWTDQYVVILIWGCIAPP